MHHHAHLPVPLAVVLPQCQHLCLALPHPHLAQYHAHLPRFQAHQDQLAHQDPQESQDAVDFQDHLDPQDAQDQWDLWDHLDQLDPQECLLLLHHHALQSVCNGKHLLVLCLAQPLAHLHAVHPLPHPQLCASHHVRLHAAESKYGVAQLIRFELDRKHQVLKNFIDNEQLINLAYTQSVQTQRVLPTVMHYHPYM